MLTDRDSVCASPSDGGRLLVRNKTVCPDPVMISHGTANSLKLACLFDPRAQKHLTRPAEPRREGRSRTFAREPSKGSGVFSHCGRKARHGLATSHTFLENKRNGVT